MVLGWIWSPLAENAHDPRFRKRPTTTVRSPRHDLLECLWDEHQVRCRRNFRSRLNRCAPCFWAALPSGHALGSKQAAAKEYQTFHLYSNPRHRAPRASGHQLQLLSHFPGSAGLPVGEVTLYGLGSARSPVSACLRSGEGSHCRAGSLPGGGRSRHRYRHCEGQPGKLAEEMIRRGLRATLEAPSLISGPEDRGLADDATHRRPG